jgi:hypothetical protein
MLRGAQPFLLVCAAAGSLLGQALVIGDLTDEDRQVLVVALNSYKPASTLLLDSTVSLCEGNAPPLCIKRDLLDAVEPTAWGSVDRRAMGNAFRIRNATSWRLANVSVALMVAPGAQIRSIFRNPLGWREVHAKCPGISSLR